MSADPAGFGLVNPMGSDGKPRGGYSVIEGLNWYSYVSNNPVKYVDPTGMWSFSAGVGSGFALMVKIEGGNNRLKVTLSLGAGTGAFVSMDLSDPEQSDLEGIAFSTGITIKSDFELGQASIGLEATGAEESDFQGNTETTNVAEISLTDPVGIETSIKFDEEGFSDPDVGQSSSGGVGMMHFAGVTVGVSIDTERQ